MLLEDVEYFLEKSKAKECFEMLDLDKDGKVNLQVCLCSSSSLVRLLCACVCVCVFSFLMTYPFCCLSLTCPGRHCIVSLLLLLALSCWYSFVGAALDNLRQSAFRCNCSQEEQQCHNA